MMRFRFELVPVGDVVPWGRDGGRSLHWFALTEGWYCLEVGGVELLRYTDRATGSSPLDGRQGPPWVDYYVVRLWEDMLAALPHILEPVPEDLKGFMAAGPVEWVDTENPDVLHNSQCDAAHDVHGLRCVDTSYLRFGPAFWWWRTVGPVDTVTVAWRFPVDPDDEISFTASLSGQASVGTDEFLAAIADFDRRLFDAMRQRVDLLAETGPPADVELDIGHLIHEQAQRQTWLPRALAQQSGTDWETVRAGVAILASNPPRR